MISVMNTFADRLTQHLKQIGWGPYDIWKWFKEQPEDDRLSEQYIYAICRGDKTPKKDDVLKKLASVEGLGLDYERLKTWKNLASASFDEKVLLLEELAASKELLPYVDKILKEKKGQP